MLIGAHIKKLPTLEYSAYVMSKFYTLYSVVFNFNLRYKVHIFTYLNIMFFKYMYSLNYCFNYPTKMIIKIRGKIVKML